MRSVNTGVNKLADWRYLSIYERQEGEQEMSGRFTKLRLEMLLKVKARDVLDRYSVSEMMFPALLVLVSKKNLNLVKH